jgi:hypothetical protein
MGWLLDMFVGIELPPDLSAKLSDVEAQYSVLESQNVTLRLEVDKLRAEVGDLRKTKPMVHADTLDDNKLAILRILANIEEIDAEYLSQLLTQQGTNLKTIELDYHLDLLVTKAFAGKQVYLDASPATYSIKQRGRAYLIEYKLL